MTSSEWKSVSERLRRWPGRAERTIDDVAQFVDAITSLAKDTDDVTLTMDSEDEQDIRGKTEKVAIFHDKTFRNTSYYV